MRIYFTFAITLLVVAIGGIVGSGCSNDHGGDGLAVNDVVIVPPFAQPQPQSSFQTVTTQELTLVFETSTTIQTACGFAAGVFAEVEDASGNRHWCKQWWPNATPTDSAQGGVDRGGETSCHFAGAPGEWTIRDVSAIDLDHQVVPCCMREFPDAISYDGGPQPVGLACQAGAGDPLDVVGEIRLSPEAGTAPEAPIEVSTCELTELEVRFGEAIQPKLADMYVGWIVTKRPVGAVFDIFGRTPFARFQAATPGEYLVEAVASEKGGASHGRYFPVMVRDNGDDSCTELLLAP